MERDHDLVLFGATGYTGGLTAAYLAAHVPDGTRWALAGRDRDRLAALRERLAAQAPGSPPPELLLADADDPESLRALAASTRAVVSTVGPYSARGGPLVAACAAEGTDYLDLCGEPEFVDRVYVEHHAAAVASGARIVHACGFDCVPHDLGAWFTVQQLPEGVPLHVEGFVRAKGTPSGGTLHSLVGVFAEPGRTLAAGRARRAAEEPPAGRRVRIDRRGVPRTRLARGWTLPLPSLDPQVVVRSAAASERYGPDFTYGHYAAFLRPTSAAAAVAGAGGLLAAAQVPALRERLLALRAPGEGPTPEQLAEGWFTVHFAGRGGGRRVYTRVSGPEPGYAGTAVMLAESALCLLHDDLPATRGQVTPATAMGNALIERLRAAGFGFEVLGTAED